MNSEKENPIVEIRTEEDAAKWIGRSVRTGYCVGACRPGGHSAGRSIFPKSSPPTVLVGVAQLPDFLKLKTQSGTYEFGTDSITGDVALIELLDGAAHPRPEGDGWVWCETSEQVIARFAGKAVGFDAGPYGRVGCRSVRDSGSAVVQRSGSAVWMVSINDSVLDITFRGGAWIRPAVSEPAKTPEREAADALEIETVAADDAAQAASMQAADLHAQLRYAQREAEEADERDSRTKADARWVLPDGWTWVRYSGKTAASADKSLGYCGSSVLVSGDSDLDLNITVSDDIDNWVPFTVAEVVIARHRAENPE